MSMVPQMALVLDAVSISGDTRGRARLSSVRGTVKRPFTFRP